MAQHLTIVCPHGRQIGTCRCPSPIKAVEVSTDCPFDCEAVPAESQSSEPQKAQEEEDRPAEVLRRDVSNLHRMSPREALLEDLEDAWEDLNLVLARSENTELFGPLEEVLNGLTALAQVRLPAVDPGTRSGGRGTRREGLSGRFSEHWGTTQSNKD